MSVCLLICESCRELGKEVGFVLGFCQVLRKHLEHEKKWIRIKGGVEAMERSIAEIDWSDPSKPELSDQMDQMRAKYRQICSMLGIAVVQAEADPDLF